MISIIDRWFRRQTGTTPVIPIESNGDHLEISSQAKDLPAVNPNQLSPKSINKAIEYLQKANHLERERSTPEQRLFSPEFFIDLGLTSIEAKRFAESMASHEWFDPQHLKSVQYSFSEGYRPTDEQLQSGERSIRKELPTYKISVELQDIIRSVGKIAGLEQEKIETIIQQFALKTGISNTGMTFSFHLKEDLEDQYYLSGLQQFFTEARIPLKNLPEGKVKILQKNIINALQKGQDNWDRVLKILESEEYLFDKNQNPLAESPEGHKAYILGILQTIFKNNKNTLQENFLKQEILWSNAREVMSTATRVFNADHGWTGDKNSMSNGVEHIAGNTESIDVAGHYLWTLDEDERDSAYCFAATRLGNNECTFSALDFKIPMTWKERITKFRELLQKGFGPHEDANFVAHLHSLLGTFGSLSPEKGRKITWLGHSMGGAMLYRFFSVFGERIDKNVHKDTEFSVIAACPALFDPSVSRIDSNFWAKPLSALNVDISSFASAFTGSSPIGALTKPLAELDKTGIINAISKQIAGRVLGQYLKNETREDIAEAHLQNYMKKPLEAFIGAIGATRGQEQAPPIDWNVFSKIKHRLKFLSFTSQDDGMVNPKALLANHLPPEQWQENNQVPMGVMALNNNVLKEANPNQPDKQQGSHYDFLRVLRQQELGLMIRLVNKLNPSQWEFAKKLFYDAYFKKTQEESISHSSEYISTLSTSPEKVKALKEVLDSPLLEEITDYLVWRMQGEGSAIIEISRQKAKFKGTNLYDVIFLQHPELFAGYFFMKDAKNDEQTLNRTYDTLRTLQSLKHKTFNFKSGVGLDITQAGGVLQMLGYPEDTNIEDLLQKLEALGKLELVLRGLENFDVEYNWDGSTMIQDLNKQQGADMRNPKARQKQLQPIKFAT